MFQRNSMEISHLVCVLFREWKMPFTPLWERSGSTNWGSSTRLMTMDRTASSVAVCCHDQVSWWSRISVKVKIPHALLLWQVNCFSVGSFGGVCGNCQNVNFGPCADIIAFVTFAKNRIWPQHAMHHRIVPWTSKVALSSLQPLYGSVATCRPICN